MNPDANKVNNPLNAMQPNERMLCEIRRHPVGIIGMYVMAGLLLIIVAVVAFIVAPRVLPNADRGQVAAAGGLAFVIMAALCAVFLLASHYIYWNNRWIVTSDSITQILQSSLFNRQSAQLSLGNLEDITVEQNGMFTHMFNYGVIKAETAGEREKFVFIYCPRPNEYARTILSAREQFEAGHHGGKQQPYSTQTSQADDATVTTYEVPDGQ